jgi:hypothetical protein
MLQRNIHFDLVGNLIEAPHGVILAKFTIWEGDIQSEAYLEIIKVISLGYEAQLTIRESDFNHRTHLNPGFATARERIKCIIRYNGKVYKWAGLLPVEYPVIAEPVLTKDMDLKRDVHTVILRTYGEGSTLREVRQRKALRSIVLHENKVSSFASRRTKNQVLMLPQSLPLLQVAS